MAKRKCHPYGYSKLLGRCRQRPGGKKKKKRAAKAKSKGRKQAKPTPLFADVVQFARQARKYPCASDARKKIQNAAVAQIQAYERFVAANPLSDMAKARRIAALQRAAVQVRQAVVCSKKKTEKALENAWMRRNALGAGIPVPASIASDGRSANTGSDPAAHQITSPSEPTFAPNEAAARALFDQQAAQAKAEMDRAAAIPTSAAATPQPSAVAPPEASVPAPPIPYQTARPARRLPRAAVVVPMEFEPKTDLIPYIPVHVDVPVSNAPYRATKPQKLVTLPWGVHVVPGSAVRLRGRVMRVNKSGAVVVKDILPASATPRPSDPRSSSILKPFYLKNFPNSALFPGDDKLIEGRFSRQNKDGTWVIEQPLLFAV